MSKKTQHGLRHLLAQGIAGFLLAGAGASAMALTQSSAYDYDANGFLLKEIIEPGDADACVAKVYAPDDFGRRKDSRLRNCNGSTATLAGAAAEAGAPSTTDGTFPDRDAQVVFKNPVDTTDTERRFPTQISNILAQTTTLTFDRRFGLPASVVDANGITTKFAYDSFGRPTQQIGPDGIGVATEYLFCSGVNGGTLATCPTNGVWAERSTPVRGASITLDANGVATVTAGTQNGPIRIAYHDAQGRTLRVESQGFDGTAVYTDLTVQRTASGNVVKTSKPYYKGAAAVWTTKTNDVLGRAVEIDAPAGNGGTAVATLSYSGLSVTVTSPDPNNDGARVSSTTTRNRIGLVASVRDAALRTMTHTYDAFGNRVQTIDVAGNVTSATFDAHGYGKSTKTYDADLGVWSYTYDVLGEIRSRTTSRGKKSSFSYDGVGRLASRTEPDLTSTWIYDNCANGKGALCEVTGDNGFDRAYTYDTAGRQTQVVVKMPGGGAQYTGGVHFNSDGRVDSSTYPGSGVVVNNAYVPTYGYLASVTDATPGASSHPVYWTGEKFDASGRPTQYTYGNQVRTTTSYYDDGHMNTAAAGLLVNGVSSANEVQNVQYAYHLAGTLQNRVDNDAPGNGAVVTAYSYDALARLTGETRSGGGVSGTQSLAWTYDAIGNIATRADSTLQNGYVNVYNYNGSGSGSVLPHAVASISGFVDNVVVPRYGYDEDGNMVSGAGRTMAWNSFDALQSVTRGSTTLAYLYDPDHQRAVETETVNGAVARTTHYMNPPAGAGLYFEREFGSAGTLEKSYISANGQVVAVRQNKSGAWSTIYWHKDNLGSNIVVSDDTGHAIERLAYDPFGARRYANGVSDTAGSLVAQTTDRGFTEHEFMDEVGLVNMNGRVFDAQLGRFLSADTLSSVYDTQGMNRYSYARNSPTGRIDPSGHDDVSGSSFGISLGDDELSGIGIGSGTGGFSSGGGFQLTPAPRGTPGSFYLSVNDPSNVPNVVNITMRSFIFEPLQPNAMANMPGVDDPRFAFNNPVYSGQLLQGRPESHLGMTLAHGAVDAASLIPILNIPGSLISAGWSAYDGDWAGAGLSLVGIIPVLGEAAAAAKIVRNAERAEKLAVEVVDAAKACGCCFAAGTPVLTESGPMPIEQVKVGTKVQSRDEKTGRVELKPVTDLIRHDGRAIFSLVYVSPNGKSTRIEVSDNHQFWVEGKGWIESGKLQRGMHLRDFDGKAATVVNLQSTGRTAMTYNFTVADNHTFYAGEHSVLVHNECACSIAARELAEAAKAEGSASRSASVLMTKDGKMYSALSGEPMGVMHDDVLGYLMGARGEWGKDIKEWHGACSEMGCINKALNDGADLEGAVMATKRIELLGSGTGWTKPACFSCSPIGDFFGISILK